MLAYAAHRRAERRLKPLTLGSVVALHAVVITAAISLKIAVAERAPEQRTALIQIPLDPVRPTVEPEKEKPKTDQPMQPKREAVDRVPPIVDRPLTPTGFDIGPPARDVTPDIGDALRTPVSPPEPIPLAEPVRIAARLATPPDRLRPPYPEAKRRSEEEAVLRLRLSIGADGRVTAVDPVGQADPQFLAAARTHLLRYWRYRPATEDGRGIASSLVITLRFELDDE